MNAIIFDFVRKVVVQAFLQVDENTFSVFFCQKRRQIFWLNIHKVFLQSFRNLLLNNNDFAFGFNQEDFRGGFKEDDIIKNILNLILRDVQLVSIGRVIVDYIKN